MTAHCRRTSKRLKLLKSHQKDCLLQEMKAIAAAKEVLFKAQQKQSITCIICTSLHKKVAKTLIEMSHIAQKDLCKDR